MSELQVIPDAGARPPSAGGRGRRPGLVWSIGAVAIAALILLPVVAVLVRLAQPSDGVWDHLAATLLPVYVVNSLALVAGVVSLAVAIGVGAGWLVAAFDFPGRRVFEWALILPMTVPGYVIAIVYFDLLTFAGPVQTALREATGWRRGDYWFPQVASLPGAAVLLALVLYPYVYLLARTAFLRQSRHLMEAARSLGIGPWAAFGRVALPLARPAIAAGAGFVAMETLADYGTVQHLGVPTLTSGIFRTWFAAGSPVAAAQLAALLLGFVAFVLVLERAGRAGRRYATDPGGRAAVIPRRRLGPAGAAAAAAACLVPVALGFLLPVAELARHHLATGDSMWGPRFFTFARNSLVLAGVAAAVILALGLFLAYARRLDGGRAVQAAIQAAGFGYAIPGAVIAVGVLFPLAWADRTLNAILGATLGLTPGLVFTGTIAALLFAYTVRFLAIALSSLEAGLARIPPSFDEAARSLGSGPAGALARVHLPLLRPSILSAAIFVFADVMKELPATLIVRPFNFDTLAVRVFRLAADARVAEASTGALVIVAAGIVPVVLLSRAMNAETPRRRGAPTAGRPGG
ncbi:MAG: iron ABC transporter permease [Rhodobacteraceae bacterium]|nr:iron ABC transporter permease [Paracoccaceae bacterium]